MCKAKNPDINVVNIILKINGLYIFSSTRGLKISEICHEPLIQYLIVKNKWDNNKIIICCIDVETDMYKNIFFLENPDDAKMPKLLRLSLSAL